MINAILNCGIKLSVSDNGNLAFKGDADTVQQWKPALKQWKPELIKLLSGETIADVGSCDHCGADLIGLLCFDGYVNRVCGACGCWAIGLPPDLTRRDLNTRIEE